MISIAACQCVTYYYILYTARSLASPPIGPNLAKSLQGLRNVASASKEGQLIQIGIYSFYDWMVHVSDIQWHRSLVKGLIEATYDKQALIFTSFTLNEKYLSLIPSWRDL